MTRQLSEDLNGGAGWIFDPHPHHRSVSGHQRRRQRLHLGPAQRRARSRRVGASRSSRTKTAPTTGRSMRAARSKSTRSSKSSSPATPSPGSTIITATARSKSISTPPSASIPTATSPKASCGSSTTSVRSPASPSPSPCTPRRPVSKTTTPRSSLSSTATASSPTAPAPWASALHGDVDENGSLEDMVIHSRWNADGSGRADISATGGDLGTDQVTASECWDNRFQRVYYADSAGWLEAEGDEAACSYAEAQFHRPVNFVSRFLPSELARPLPGPRHSFIWCAAGCKSL